MDGDWCEVTRIPFSQIPAVPSTVMTLAFDHVQELLWTGNESGRVASFHGTHLEPYTSFRMHMPPEKGAVRQILVTDWGILALSATDLHMALRRGLPLWHLENTDMTDMQCMSFTSRGTTEALVAGYQDVMLVVDLFNGEVIKRMYTRYHYSIMRRGRYICAATSTGDVNFLDPDTFAVLRTWSAHSAYVNDIDTHGDFVLSCGYSLRQSQSYTILDPFINSFDVRNMSSMTPIAFPAGAAFVRMHPRLETTCIATSQSGQIHVVDLLNQTASTVRQANVLSYLGLLEIAPSGEAIAFTDGECNIHLWGSPSKICFVDGPTPVEFPDGEYRERERKTGEEAAVDEEEEEGAEEEEEDDDENENGYDEDEDAEDEDDDADDEQEEVYEEYYEDYQGAQDQYQEQEYEGPEEYHEYVGEAAGITFEEMEYIERQYAEGRMVELAAEAADQEGYAEDEEEDDDDEAEDEDEDEYDWPVDKPLSLIGMPHYRDELLSAWPADLVCDAGAPPERLDPQYLATLTPYDYGLYGKPREGMRPNQTVEYRAPEKLPDMSAQAPKFLSERAKESKKTPGPGLGLGGCDGAADDDSVAVVSGPVLAQPDLSEAEPDIPLMYRTVKIKYSKFGVDDFDFGFYNKTAYSGLESHISNSYANSLFQLMHFTPLFRNLALAHAASACMTDYCLLCELGYLFDMLQKAGGSICQATNMLKALSCHPRASALGLLEEEPRGMSQNAILHTLTRFLVDRMVQDFRTFPTAGNITEDIMSLSSTVYQTCIHCKSEVSSQKTSYVVDMQYPQPKGQKGRGFMAPKLGQPTLQPSFSQVLRFTMEGETTTKGWCKECHRYMPISMRKSVHTIPSLFTLNTGMMLDEHRKLWAIPGWLPEEVGVILDSGNNQVFCYEGEDLRLHLQRGVHPIRVYSLVGVVASIEAGEQEKQHFVGMMNVTSEEALRFNTTWKVPTVLVFQVKEANHWLDSQWKACIDTSVLYQGISPRVRIPSFRPLDPIWERPGPQTVVALDTEFVSVRQPEIEVSSEGEREIIRPIVHSLARVSVVRGGRRGYDCGGDDDSGYYEIGSDGFPFIDDYIAIREPIINFLTSYSGIMPQDLDPRTSCHNLVTAKVAYKKLWVLLNLGCRFLGHGLRQDFRVINIQVPLDQVIDTSFKFYLPDRLRKLSLAFLAWALLGEDIQLHTHDSVEDARTALKLYRQYVEFERKGTVEAQLLSLYSKGRKVNYKPQRREGEAEAAAVDEGEGEGDGEGDGDGDGEGERARGRGRSPGGCGLPPAPPSPLPTHHAALLPHGSPLLTWQPPPLPYQSHPLLYQLPPQPPLHHPLPRQPEHQPPHWMMTPQQLPYQGYSRQESSGGGLPRTPSPPPQHQEDASFVTGVYWTPYRDQNDRQLDRLGSTPGDLPWLGSRAHL